LEKTLEGLARGGTAVSIGAASGPPPAIQLGQLRERCIRLAGGSVFSYTADPSELRRRASDLVEAISEGWLRMGEGTAYDLERAAEAHRDIEGRATQGKLYLTP
jgi:NADPH2:quinone reductase